MSIPTLYRVLNTSLDYITCWHPNASRTKEKGNFLNVRKIMCLFKIMLKSCKNYLPSLP